MVATIGNYLGESKPLAELLRLILSFIYSIPVHLIYESHVIQMLLALNDTEDSFTQLTQCIDPNLTRYHKDSLLQVCSFFTFLMNFEVCHFWEEDYSTTQNVIKEDCRATLLFLPVDCPWQLFWIDLSGVFDLTFLIFPSSKMAFLSKDCVDDNWSRRPDMSRVVLCLSHILLHSKEWEELECNYLEG